MISTGVGPQAVAKTSVAAMDMKTDRKAYRLATRSAQYSTNCFEARHRWQTSEPFEYCDGVHTPPFEELPRGVEAISAVVPHERQKMFAGSCLRTAFRHEGWECGGHELFNRNLAEMWVFSSPISGRKVSRRRTGSGGGCRTLDYS